MGGPKRKINIGNKLTPFLQWDFKTINCKINLGENVMHYLLTGEYIRKIRESELKKSKEEFAEELGISLHTLNRLENAERKVTNIEIFEKISKMSGHSLDQIIKTSNNTTKNKEILISKIQNSLYDFNEKELFELSNIIESCKKLSKRKK